MSQRRKLKFRITGELTVAPPAAPPVITLGTGITTVVESLNAYLDFTVTSSAPLLSVTADKGQVVHRSGVGPTQYRWYKATVLADDSTSVTVTADNGVEAEDSFSLTVTAMPTVDHAVVKTSMQGTDWQDLLDPVSGYPGNPTSSNVYNAQYPLIAELQAWLHSDDRYHLDEMKTFIANMRAAATASIAVDTAEGTTLNFCRPQTSKGATQASYAGWPDHPDPGDVISSLSCIQLCSAVMAWLFEIKENTGLTTTAADQTWADEQIQWWFYNVIERQYTTPGGGYADMGANNVDRAVTRTERTPTETWDNGWWTGWIWYAILLQAFGDYLMTSLSWPGNGGVRPDYLTTRKDAYGRPFWNYLDWIRDFLGIYDNPNTPQYGAKTNSVEYGLFGGSNWDIGNTNFGSNFNFPDTNDPVSIEYDDGGPDLYHSMRTNHLCHYLTYIPGIPADIRNECHAFLTGAKFSALNNWVYENGELPNYRDGNDSAYRGLTSPMTALDGTDYETPGGRSGFYFPFTAYLARLDGTLWTKMRAHLENCRAAVPLSRFDLTQFPTGNGSIQANRQTLGLVSMEANLLSGLPGPKAVTNSAPTVVCDPDKAGVINTPIPIGAAVSDDGLPDPPGVTTQLWTRDSGPGAVVFGDATAKNTTADFDTAGTHVLRCTADDSALQTFDTMEITVTAPSGNAHLQTSVDVV